MTIKAIEKSILKLKPVQRLQLIDHIMDSLHKPDPAIERAWAIESDKRLLAYKNGKIKGIPLETVKKRLAK